MTRSRDLANLADSTEFTSADHSKLDGIEASATADQTNAQIKTAVQAGADIALGGNPTTTTQSAGNNTTRVATTAFTQAAITALVGSVPATLNTLAELGDALGDDPNYATTTSNLIGTKMPLAGGAFTGAVTTNSTFDGVDIATRDGVLTTTTNTANAALPKAGGTMSGALNVDAINNASGNLNILSTQSILMKFDSDNDQTNREFNIQSNTGTQLFKVTETGLATFTGKITGGVATGRKLFLGDYTSSSSGDPTSLSLGARFSDTAGEASSIKIQLWENSLDTTASGYNAMGFGVSSNQIDYVAGDNAYKHAFWVGSSKQLAIDSNGVGLGTASIHDASWGSAGANKELAIDGTTGYSVIHLRGTGAGSTDTRFSHGVGDTKYFMAYDDVVGAHRMIVDASGNILVGKSATNSDANGVEISQSGQVYITANGTLPFYINRRGTSGNNEFARFSDDGATRGSISSAFANELIVSASGTNSSGILFSSANTIRPMKNGATSSGTQDLGAGNGKWKDLYLSGGVNFGAATGQSGRTVASPANTLSDYEFGSWTPTVTGGTCNVNSALYVRVGNQVTISFYINNVAPPANTSLFLVAGLPFSKASYAGNYSAIPISYWGSMNLTGVSSFNTGHNGTVNMYLHTSNHTAVALTNNDIIASGSLSERSFIVGGTYITNQ